VGRMVALPAEPAAAGGGSELFPRTRPERWYALGAHAGLSVNSSTNLSAANILNLYPITMPQTMTFDALAVRIVSSTYAPSVARFGIYASLADSFYPGALLWGSTEKGLGAAADLVDAGIGPLTLDAGELYWLAWIHGNGAGGGPANPSMCYLGVPGPFPTTGAGDATRFGAGTTQRAYLTKAHVLLTGVGLPDPAPAAMVWSETVPNNPIAIVGRTVA
jgi:hypothetical protein